MTKEDLVARAGRVKVRIAVQGAYISLRTCLFDVVVVSDVRRRRVSLSTSLHLLVLLHLVLVQRVASV